MTLPKRSNRAGLSGFRSKVIDEVVPSFKRPDFAATLSFPADITKISTEEVSRKMGWYVECEAWAVREAAGLTARIAETENNLDRVKALLYQEEPSVLAALNQNERKEKFLTYPAIVKVQHTLRLLHARKTELESYALCCERYGMVLSRELSRRTSFRESTFGHARNAANL